MYTYTNNIDSNAIPITAPPPLAAPVKAQTSIYYFQWGLMSLAMPEKFLDHFDDFWLAEFLPRRKGGKCNFTSRKETLIYKGDEGERNGREVERIRGINRVKLRCSIQ